MSSAKTYPVLDSALQNTHLTNQQYLALYEESIRNPETFWQQQAKSFLSWSSEWKKVTASDLTKGISRWFIGGKLNVSVNCIDRHLPAHAGETAIIFEGDQPGNSLHISYQQLHDNVCRMANALKKLGVTKGDRVCIYMPMIPEAAYAMLACTRIGAVHSVVFGGFSPEALKDRIRDASCKILITADEGVRGGKQIPLKENCDLALRSCPDVKTCVVVRHTGNRVPWNSGRDCWYHEITEGMDSKCPPEPMDAEDPLFILYTSGSTGKPKGVLHATAGYLLGVTMTHHYVFDYQPGEVYWCTADIGWITGHSYVLYGPLANRATTLMFEGIPTYPDASRIWQVVDKHKVAILYTAPTAIRTLMAAGNQFVSATSRKSLRLLGSVGEPINPEAWEWYYHIAGEGRCPVVDTWWQTETGGIMISATPGATTLKPGSATRPFFGVQPVLLDENGRELAGEASGVLAIKGSWPSQLVSVYGDHQRCIETYYSRYPGYYFTGDGARRDADGYYWITGRVDDVLNVSGHRLGTAEIESALVLHEAVAEAAVVGFPHRIKGEAVYAFVTLIHGYTPSAALEKALMEMVSKEISPIAKPDFIQFSPELPKTRSGKIMRRILRKIASNELDNLGDTSTLAIPAVVDSLIANRKNC
jgi:acetyl-CoA synthetase